MKFARICFKPENEKHIADKFPKPLRRKYYMSFYKIKPVKIKMFTSEGFLTYIPFEKNEKDFELVKKYISKTVLHLTEEGAGVFSAEKGMQMPYGTKTADGTGLLCLMIKDILNTAYNIRSVSAGECETVIIDGGNNASKILLNSIAGHVPKLCVYTLRKDKLLKTFEYIFENTGLSIVPFSVANDKIIRKADIIINLNKGNIFYDCFADNAVFVDMAGDAKYTEQIMKNRKDIKILNDFSLFQEEKEIPLDYTEAALCAHSDAMRQILFGNFNIKKYNIAADFFHSLNLKLLCASSDSNNA